MAEAPRRRLLATLRARFDRAALDVALPGQPGWPLSPPTAAQTARWAALQTWCFEGAGDGCSPLLQPRRAPAVAQRFAVATWPASHPTALDDIEAFSRHLDGSHQLLAAGGAVAGLGLRLRVKLCEAAWWRARHASDPWDCGHAVNEERARAALQRFEPRRPTLVVAMNWPGDDQLAAITGLAEASVRFLHPVRWLAVDTVPQALADRLRHGGIPVTELQPRAAAV